MKIASLALATALIAIVGSVQPTFAQSYNSSGENAGNSSDSGSEMDAPSQPNDQWNRDRDWHHGGWGRDGGGMGPPSMHHGWMEHHHRMMGMMRMMGGREGGARFHFKRGDASIDIRCPANEDLQACVNAASKLIDKVTSMGEHHASAPGTNPPPPPPPKSGPPAGGTNGSGDQNGGKGPNGPTPGHTAAPFNNRT